jgi:hypothetical protein
VYTVKTDDSRLAHAVLSLSLTGCCPFHFH